MDAIEDSKSDPLATGPALVPDLIKLDDIPENFLQRVETDLLETSVFQAASATRGGFARFELAQKGFLHSHSKILLSLVPPAGQGGYALLPANIGIASLIDRAVLKVRKSGQVINDIQDFGHFHAIKSCQISNETNREREQYMTGRIMNKDFKYYFDDGAANEAIFNKDLSYGYGLDNGRDYTGTGAARGEAQQGLTMPFAQIDAAAPTESPTYSIDISDLFLFMKTQSLPLYMIDQGLTIELHLSQAANARVVRGTGFGGGASPNYLVDVNELKLVADYIHYVEDDAMNRYRDANPVIDLTFSDYRLSKNSRTQAEINAGFVRQLGMNNRVVPRVVTMISREGAENTADGDAGLLNKYNMIAPDLTQEVAGVLQGRALSFNVRYKSRFEFSQPISNKAQAFTQLTQSEGLPFVSMQEYSTDGGGYLVGRNNAAQQTVTTAATFEGKSQVAQLGGHFFLLGTRLTNGRVANDGVELHLGATLPDPVGGGATAYVVRSYLEYVRRARLEDGEMEVMNA